VKPPRYKGLSTDERRRARCLLAARFRHENGKGGPQVPATTRLPTVPPAEKCQEAMGLLLRGKTIAEVHRKTGIPMLAVQDISCGRITEDGRRVECYEGEFFEPSPTPRRCPRCKRKVTTFVCVACRADGRRVETLPIDD